MRNEINSYNTKLLLANTLKELLKRKPFAKVTVTEIIKLSEVNRNTFYYHFEDIYDLLLWFLNQEAINKVRNYDSIDDINDAINFTLDYIDENRKFLKNIINSVGEHDLKRFLSKDFLEIIGNYIRLAEKEMKIDIDEDYRNFLTTYITEAIAGILIELIYRKDSAPHDKINYFIQVTSENAIIASLKAIRKVKLPGAMYRMTY